MVPQGTAYFKEFMAGQAAKKDTKPKKGKK
jgi:hypothetical protein